MTTMWVLIITIMVAGEPEVTVRGAPSEFRVTISNLLEEACQHGRKELGTFIMAEAGKPDEYPTILSFRSECVLQDAI